MDRTLFNEEHDLFRAAFRQFVDKEIVPHHLQWETDGIVPRELFAKAGASGFLGMDVDEAYGGGGADEFTYNLIVGEEVQRSGTGGAGLGITLHNDICIPYFTSLATEEQKKRWLQGICSGELITAIAMTEPSIGSDLASMGTTAVRDGDSYIVNGSKTFITNGINADLIITAVKTDPTQRHKGMSLLVIERDMAGFERGRNLEKVGLHSQDTAELFFNDVRVPAANLIGEEGAGFAMMMQQLPQERLAIAVGAQAMMERGIELTLDYVRERKAFGQPIGQFQNSRFKLAECVTLAKVSRAFLDDCIVKHVEGVLSTAEASMAKYHITDLMSRVLDECVQLHGGYGYMEEYPISRLWVDGRVQRIYGCTNEIMKDIISRSLI
ncbi:MAG: acyl-CoA dehydrogenase family protein [Acidimicrobiales bacterium]|nr:acyl-CoA dehydrogenase family protein [Acidimicrobiales bacterium]